MKGLKIFLRVLFISFLFVTTVLAYLPIFPQGNENISSAYHMDDPRKSLFLHGTLEPQSPKYFSIDLEQGDTINISLLKSGDPNENRFRPDMVLVGPGYANTDALNQSKVSQSTTSDKERGDSVIYNASFYEPFGPSSYRTISHQSLSATKTARYYIKVFTAETIGHYSVIIGNRDEFSFFDRIFMPIRLVSVYKWEGQSITMILVPYLVAELLGIVVFWRGGRHTAYCLAGTLAGFFFVASCASIISQIAFSMMRSYFSQEVYISVLIAIFHALLGVITLQLARGEAGLMQRCLFAIIGTIALLAGSGLIIGSLLAIAASVMPSHESIFRKNAMNDSISRNE